MAPTSSSCAFQIQDDPSCPTHEARVMTIIPGATMQNVKDTLSLIHQKLETEFGGAVHYDIVKKIVIDILYGKQAELITSMVSSLSPAQLAEVISIETARHDTRRAVKPVIISKVNAPVRKPHRDV